jgi:hypothetical protein
MEKKFIISGVFFVFIILTGLCLSRLGKPINILLLTVHKLFSVGALMFLGISVYRINQAAPLNTLEIVVCVVTFLFFLILIATGGIISAAKTTNAIVLTIHKFCPIIVVISTFTLIYLIIGRKL